MRDKDIAFFDFRTFSNSFSDELREVEDPHFAACELPMILPWSLYFYIYFLNFFTNTFFDNSFYSTSLKSFDLMELTQINTTKL